MKYISFLIKPASSLCNLRCRYCFYYDVANNREIKSHNIMQEDTIKALVDKALGLDDDAQITFAFQGGEPTVAGIEYFKYFTSYVDSHKTSQTIYYAIQTNTTLIDDSWCELFKKYNFLVGVSLDGFEDLHDFFRKDVNLDGTFDKVMRNIKLLEEYKIDFNILTVLTSKLAKYPKELFSFYLKNKFKYIQLIPCLPGLKENENLYSLKPHEFSDFYKIFFDEWLKELKNGNYISINLFDNLIQLFNGIRPSQCGILGYCLMQFVVEANGDVYPCDFYVLDEYLSGNIKKDSLVEMLKSKNTQKFLNESRRECKECDNCKFKKICNKNCKRLNITYFDDEYCGYKDFLEYAFYNLQNNLQNVARYFKVGYYTKHI